MAVTIRLGDIFTPDEIAHISAMAANGASAGKIADEVIAPIIDRIDAETGQPNDALYLAYAVLYQVEVMAKTKRKWERPQKLSK